MRNISFSLTQQQLRDRTKTVTRRLGWQHIKPGELLKPVEKCMGLQAGQKVIPIGGPIRVVHIRREALRDMVAMPEYGDRECMLEGFPHLRPHEFVAMFCSTHRHCTIDTVVTRITFEYADKA